MREDDMRRAYAIDIEALVREIQEYLEVVELFRSEGCEPSWSARGVDDDGELCSGPACHTVDTNEED
jgi:hypothetical protein